MKDWHFFGISTPLWFIASQVADTLWLSLPFTLNGALCAVLMFCPEKK